MSNLTRKEKREMSADLKKSQAKGRVPDETDLAMDLINGNFNNWNDTKSKRVILTFLKDYLTEERFIELVAAERKDFVFRKKLAETVMLAADVCKSRFSNPQYPTDIAAREETISQAKEAAKYQCEEHLIDDLVGVNIFKEMINIYGIVKASSKFIADMKKIFYIAYLYHIDQFEPVVKLREKSKMLAHMRVPERKVLREPSDAEKKLLELKKIKLLVLENAPIENCDIPKIKIQKICISNFPNNKLSNIKPDESLKYQARLRLIKLKNEENKRLFELIKDTNRPPLKIQKIKQNINYLKAKVLQSIKRQENRILKLTCLQKPKFDSYPPSSDICIAKKMKLKKVESAVYNHLAFSKCTNRIKTGLFNLKHVRVNPKFNLINFQTALFKKVNCQNHGLHISRTIKRPIPCPSRFGPIKEWINIKSNLRKIDITPSPSEFTSLGITFTKSVAYLMERFNCDYQVLKGITEIDPTLWFKKGKYIMSQCLKAVYIYSKNFKTKHFITFLQKITNCSKGLKRTYKYTYWYVFGEELHLASRFHKEVTGKTLPKQCVLEYRDFTPLDYEMKSTFESAVLEIMNFGLANLKYALENGVKKIADISFFTVF
jgi:hypothetical protein